MALNPHCYPSSPGGSDGGSMLLSLKIRKRSLGRWSGHATFLLAIPTELVLAKWCSLRTTMTVLGHPRMTTSRILS